MFIFCLFLLAMAILFLILSIIFKDEYSAEDLEITSAVFAVILLLCSLSIPLVRVCYSDNIAAFKTIQITVDTQRQIENEYEQAILTTKIIDANWKLARWQNQNVWYRLDWWIPDSVKELELIK